MKLSNKISNLSVLQADSFKQYLLTVLRSKLFFSPLRENDKTLYLKVGGLPTTSNPSELIGMNAKSKLRYRHLVIDYNFVKNLEKFEKILDDNLQNLKDVQVLISISTFLNSPPQVKEVLNRISQSNVNSKLNFQLDKDICASKSRTQVIDDFKLFFDDMKRYNWLREQFILTYKVTSNNCIYSDDVLRAIPNQYHSALFFYPSEELLLKVPSNDNEQYHELRFHMLMFFDSLTRPESGKLGKRKYYERIVHLLDGDKNLLKRYLWNCRIEERVHLDQTPPDSQNNYNQHSEQQYRIESLIIPECFVLPNFVELFDLTFKILKSKFTNKKVVSLDQVGVEHNGNSIDFGSPKSWKHVLITGWYGTETNGDKAILGEVLHFIRSCSPSCKITLTTIYEKISQQTNRELELLEGVELIDIKNAYHPKLINNYDAVVMGGGPLMETSEMHNINRIFIEAHRQKKSRIIFGCGVGPIHSDKIKEVTSNIIKLTTAGFLRDKESYDYATRLCETHVLKYACDPAIAFVSRWRKRCSTQLHIDTNSIHIACLLRSNTNEFSERQSKEQLSMSNYKVAGQIAGVLDRIVEENETVIDLLYMNAPWVGGDDRLFNRQVNEQSGQPEKINLVRKYLTLEEHLEQMISTDVSVVMRYHGHLFSMALGIPFLSVDYTGKMGKVSSFVSRIGYENWTQRWDGFETEQATTRLQKLIVERGKWSQYLLEQTDLLVSELYGTYKEVFGVEIAHCDK